MLRSQATRSPEDARVRSALGIAVAALGETEVGLREARLGVELSSTADNALLGAWRLRDLALVQTLAGNPAEAVASLESLLSGPSWFSVNSIAHEPEWDDLRECADYQRLIERHRPSHHKVSPRVSIP